MKLIIISIVSWLTGIGAYLLSLFIFYGETIGRADLIAVLFSSALASTVAFLTVYTPIMFLLKRILGGCKPAFVFPLTASLIFVLPTMLIMLAFNGGTNFLKACLQT